MFFQDLEPIQRLSAFFALAKDSSVWLQAVDREVIDMIIQLNTEDQLEEQGIDSLGRSLGEYSPYTIAIKRMKGDRYDHVTLKDTGAFYNSWVVWVDRDAINIDADDVAFYDRPLFEIWGEDVLGLTDENLEIVKGVILEKYMEILMQRL